MSFKFRSQTITLENYRQVFKACTPDILDEIRSAVLDDTSITPFIKPCGTDSYLLGQLRMGVRELIPIEYLSAYVTGKTIYNIRQGFLKGRDMSALLKYYTNKVAKIDKSTIEKLSEFCLVGTDITKIDFSIIPNELVDIVCKGLYQGYPMWLLIDNETMPDERTIHILMRGMSAGVDIHPFLSGDWSIDSMLLLFSYAKSVDLNDVLQYINSHFSSDSIKVLLDLASENIPIANLCRKDTSGVPVYNSYQMYELGKAIKEGVDTEAMYNANLSDFEISEMREAELAKKNRKLSATLKKKS
jgi:hypothetical protein